MNWREEYRAKIQTADQALARLRSGQRVFVGSSCGEPQHLVDALLGGAERLRDLEIVRLLSLEGSITSIYGDREYGH
ncbi:MAG TPA: acetyl-CoA hydrolase, partial [Spirochaetota bacterium]|nr:acetyl-CoA hydrolase [Spirochaetota bacterium]